jgi:SSS family solute:Na+ symporter
MAVSGAIYLSGAGVVLLGGLYWKRASSVGALAAMIAGLIAIVGLFLKPFNAQLQEWGIEYKLTGPLVGLFNFGLCAVVFVVVSLLVPDRPKPEPAHPPAGQ